MIFWKNCCGLHGPSDFREFIYNKHACNSILEDVPFTCLDLFTVHDHCVNGFGHAKQYCYVYNFTQKAIIFKNEDENKKIAGLSIEEKSKYKCEHVKAANSMVNSEIQQLFDTKVRGNGWCIYRILLVPCYNAVKLKLLFFVQLFWIHKQGCMSVMIENCQSLREANYFYLYLIIALAWSMVISYLTYWFDAVSKLRKQIELDDMDMKPTAYNKTIGYITFWGMYSIYISLYWRHK